jgi:hypothetical protein
MLNIEKENVIFHIEYKISTSSWMTQEMKDWCRSTLVNFTYKKSIANKVNNTSIYWKEERSYDIVSDCLDYMRDPDNEKDLKKLKRRSVDQMIAKHKVWSEKASRGVRRRNVKPLPPKNVLLTYPDGFYITQLVTKADYTREGQLMANCVGSYFNYPGILIFSLRDTTHKPLVTIEVQESNGEIHQARAFANSNSTDFKPYLDDLNFKLYLKEFIPVNNTQGYDHPDKKKKKREKTNKDRISSQQLLKSIANEMRSRSKQNKGVDFRIASTFILKRNFSKKEIKERCEEKKSVLFRRMFYLLKDEKGNWNHHGDLNTTTHAYLSGQLEDDYRFKCMKRVLGDTVKSLIVYHRNYGLVVARWSTKGAASRFIREGGVIRPSTIKKYENQLKGKKYHGMSSNSSI